MNRTDPTPNSSQDDTGEYPENILKSGTTCIGMIVEDGVVLASDRQTSAHFVVSKDSIKVREVHPRAAIASAGAVTDIQKVAEELRAEASQYEARRGRQMSIRALANYGSSLKRDGFYWALGLVGGVDEDGAHVFEVGMGGSVLEHQKYGVIGSGATMALGVLENEYHDELSAAEGRRICTEAVQASSERDFGSGYGLVLTTITDDGTTMETFDSLPYPDELS